MHLVPFFQSPVLVVVAKNITSASEILKSKSNNDDYLPEKSTFFISSVSSLWKPY